MTGSVSEAAVDLDEINSYLGSLGGFADNSRIAVESIDASSVQVRWHYDNNLLRPGGYVSGPTLFGVADMCGWLLVFATEGITPMAVTWDLHITFMRPAIGGDIIAEGRQLKRGKRLIYGDVLMYVDGAPDKPVAHANVTYALPQQP